MPRARAVDGGDHRLRDARARSASGGGPPRTISPAAAVCSSAAMSIPGQNARPAPVTTMARTSALRRGFVEAREVLVLHRDAPRVLALGVVQRDRRDTVGDVVVHEILVAEPRLPPPRPPTGRAVHRRDSVNFVREYLGPERPRGPGSDRGEARVTRGICDGLQVIEMGAGSIGASLRAGMLLADNGARVLKVEPPEGDRLRHAAPGGVPGVEPRQGEPRRRPAHRRGPGAGPRAREPGPTWSSRASAPGSPTAGARRRAPPRRPTRASCTAR